jgi:hypothetical protein
MFVTHSFYIRFYSGTLTLYVVGAAFVLVAVAIGITLFLRARRNRYVVHTVSSFRSPFYAHANLNDDDICASVSAASAAS